MNDFGLMIVVAVVFVAWLWVKEQESKDE